MTSEELKVALLSEIIHYKKTDELTPHLKRLLMELVWRVSHERYEMLNDNLRTMCEAKAYEDACRFSTHFNTEKADDATSYVRTIIRSSFAGTISKHGNFKKTRERYEA